MARPRKPNALAWRDEEDLRAFAAQLHYLAIHANGMEPATLGGDPPTIPKWLSSFSRGSEAALARSIWWRLYQASELYKPSATVLLALHDPAALLCDGKTSLTEEELDRARRDPTFKVREKLDVGRRLAVYPCTWTADEARRWRDEAYGRRACDQMSRGLAAFSLGKRKGGRQRIEPLERIAPYVALDGRRPVDLLARMVDAKRSARGEEAELWGQIDDEAVILVESSTRAWNETPDHRARTERWKTNKMGAVAA